MLYGIIDKCGNTTFINQSLDAHKASASLKNLFSERKMNVDVYPANIDYCATILTNYALKNVSRGTEKAKEVKHLPDVFKVVSAKQAFSACLVPDEKEDSKKQSTNNPFERLYKESGALLASLANYINACNPCEEDFSDFFIDQEQKYSDDLQDLISSGKVALFEQLPEYINTAYKANFTSEKAYTDFSGCNIKGYKAINHSIHQSKNKPLPIDKDKINLLTRLSLWRNSSEKVDNALKEQIENLYNNFLSVQEKEIVDCLGGFHGTQECRTNREIQEITGYNLELILELKASIYEKILENIDIPEYLTEKAETMISQGKALREKREQAKKARKAKHDKKRNQTPERKAYLAQKARERRAKQKAEREQA